MIGLIVVPWDNGQYSIHTNYAKAFHMIGLENNASLGFKDFGNISMMTAMVKADGIGNEINDFLDETTFFASYSKSVTDPNSKGMLGSTDSKSGHSIWLGIQMPCLLTDDGRFGLEWNQGSKYWRSMTHGEDTMIGSKIAARGTAVEAYWLKPLTKALSMSIRYTKIDYDYTGSNGFFGVQGQPNSVTGSAVSEASDLRIAMRYKF